MTAFIQSFSASSMRYLAFIALWLAIWWAAVLMEYLPYISLWYPPAGLSLAAFILMGSRAFFPVLMACLLAGYWMYFIEGSTLSFIQQSSHSLTLAAAHTCAFALGGIYFRNTIHRWHTQQLPQRILYFLIITLITSLLSAWFGVLAFFSIGSMSWPQVTHNWMAWWVGDLVGAMVLAPLFILLLSRVWKLDVSWLKSRDANQPKTTLRMEFWSHKLTLIIAIVAVVMVADYYYEDPAIAYFVFFISIPQAWLVFTESMEHTLFSLAITSTFIAIWFGFIGVTEHALTYQFAMCVIAANAYFGLSVPTLLNQNRRLDAKTKTDALTQVATRDYFLKQVSNKLASKRERDFPLSLVLFDIDRFKAINDTYGHLIGDQALVLAAQSIRSNIRDYDLIARFGGDEFLLLLPEQNLAQATQTAERLQQQLPAIATAKGMVQINASFGIAELQPDEDFDATFERADKALLIAKRKGKNQVVSSESHA